MPVLRSAKLTYRKGKDGRQKAYAHLLSRETDVDRLAVHKVLVKRGHRTFSFRHRSQPYEGKALVQLYLELKTSKQGANIGLRGGHWKLIQLHAYAGLCQVQILGLVGDSLNWRGGGS
jgi:endonuclease YncB( thermonuclease family)